MSNKTFEKRKKIIYDFICDDMYVPMKFKEMAMVLQVNKEQRDELRQVLESLEEEGKSAGLGAISGIADTYWGQNKGRSMEGALVKSTKFLAILFVVLAAVLNLKVFA